MFHIGLTRQEIEQLQNLIAQLDAQAPAGAADRRINPRIDFSHPMWLNLPSEAGRPWIHVYSRNLSTGGLSFLTRARFHTDQHVIISHELNEKAPLLVLCRVCFCRSIDMGVQEVGLSFVAVRADPQQRREIPQEWLALVEEKEAVAQPNDAVLRKIH